MLLILFLSLAHALSSVAIADMCAVRATVGEWMHRQAERWTTLQTQCRTAVLLFTDANWLSLTYALFGDLQRFNHARCVAVVYWPTANDTRACLRQLLVESAAFAGQPLLISDGATTHEASGVWGVHAYFEKINTRMLLAWALHAELAEQALALRLEHRLALALIDSDITVRRNVLARLERSNATLVVQRESVCSNGGARCPNGGFWHVKGTRRGEHLLRDVARTMHTLRVPDQEAIEIEVARRERNYNASTEPVWAEYLDALKYVNGYVLHNDSRWSLARSHIVHANWCTRLDAKRRLLQALRAGDGSARCVE